MIDIDYKIEKAAPQVGGAAFDTKNSDKNIKFKTLGGSGLNKEKNLMT